MKNLNLSTAWQMTLVIMLSVIAVMMPDMAFAAAANGDTPIGTAMCTVAGWFLGNTGQGLATLAVIIIGVGALMGKVSWGMAIIVGLGIALIFGASAMVTAIQAGGEGCAA